MLLFECIKMKKKNSKICCIEGGSVRTLMNFLII